MDLQQAVELGREAIWISLMVGAPVLIIGLAVGLVIGLLQALTQIQDQTVSFVPKVIAMILLASLTLPWILMQLLQYSHDLIAGIPGRL